MSLDPLFQAILTEWKDACIHAVRDAAHSDLGLPPDAITRVEPEQDDSPFLPGDETGDPEDGTDPEDAEPPCDHSPAAWRSCERCSDAEGDLREHDGR